jgi:uncharacterized protein (DUF486 family)
MNPGTTLYTTHTRVAIVLWVFAYIEAFAALANVFGEPGLRVAQLSMIATVISSILVVVAVVVLWSSRNYRSIWRMPLILAVATHAMLMLPGLLRTL